MVNFGTNWSTSPQIRPKSASTWPTPGRHWAIWADFGRDALELVASGQVRVAPGCVRPTSGQVWPLQALEANLAALRRTLRRALPPICACNWGFWKPRAVSIGSTHMHNSRAPELAKRSPKSKGSWNPGHCGPKSGRLGPTTSQIEPTLVGPDPVETAPRLANIGPFRRSRAQVSQSVRRNRPNLLELENQIRPTPERKARHTGPRARIKVGGRPILARAWPDIASRPRVGPKAKRCLWAHELGPAMRVGALRRDSPGAGQRPGGTQGCRCKGVVFRDSWRATLRRSFGSPLRIPHMRGTSRARARASLKPLGAPKPTPGPTSEAEWGAASPCPPLPPARARARPSAAPTRPGFIAAAAAPPASASSRAPPPAAATPPLAAAPAAKPAAMSIIAARRAPRARSRWRARASRAEAAADRDWAHVPTQSRDTLTMSTTRGGGLRDKRPEVRPG